MIRITAALVLVNVGILVAFLFRGGRGSGSSDGAPKAPSDSNPGQPGVYAVTGVVREVKADGTNLLIRHEAIPGYMPAMTMLLNVRDPREIASVQTNDQITFRLLVTDEESWIDSVVRMGVSAPAEPPPFSYEQARIVRDVEPLELGQLMPDYVFTNQFGAPMTLGDFRGRAVALTFMFTRCPLPEFCPRMLKNFAAVAEALEARTGGSTNWHLVTLTIDPLFDTVPVIKAHAERYHYDPRRWTFLTGALIDVDAITEQVGLVYRRQTPTALPDHNLRTVVIDPSGRLWRIFIGNTWKPEEVVDSILAAAAGQPPPKE